MPLSRVLHITRQLKTLCSPVQSTCTPHSGHILPQTLPTSHSSYTSPSSPHSTPCVHPSLSHWYFQPCHQFHLLHFQVRGVAGEVEPPNVAEAFLLSHQVSLCGRSQANVTLYSFPYVCTHTELLQCVRCNTAWQYCSCTSCVMS